MHTLTKQSVPSGLSMRGWQVFLYVDHIKSMAAYCFGIQTLFVNIKSADFKSYHSYVIKSAITYFNNL